MKTKSHSDLILKPEILTHPHIPKPLHGVAPRDIMGQEWWDNQRKGVYASSYFHCIACGVHRTQAKKHHWLEAHEFWKIDYSTGTCTIESIEPLCHYCHNFIHSGRLSMIMGKEKSEKEVKDILEHGFKILSKNKLKCFPFTLDLGISLDCKTYKVIPYSLPINHIEWGDWKLIWNGKEYRSKFKSEKHHKNFYSK